ncbi:uncharacterized protein ISCGN_014617 [Ixodes scapularis]
MNKSKPSKLSRRLTMQKLPINVLSLTSSAKRVCSDDENKEPSVGGSSGAACNKRAYSDDDDSPVEPGQQTSLQSAMAGEMSKILDSFGNDVAKSLRAKKRRLWQHLRTSTKNITNKMSGLDESLLAERRSVVEEFEKQVTDITEQIEDDIQKVKESEEKITKALVQYQKQHQQFIECSTNKFRSLKSLWTNYFDATKKMDAKQTAQQQKLNSEVKDEILGLQEKILTDAQEYEIVKMRSNLQSILM